MRYTETLWRAIAAIYPAIIAHPFNRELANGALPRDKFAFYMQQDALYLADFGRALAIVGGRSAAPARVLDFVHFAEGAVVVERALHGEYFRLFDIREPATTQSPSCFAYTNYLLATAALRSYEEAVAALLPCFWIYRAVGTHILETATPANPYQRWIDTYAGDEFGRLVARAIAIADETASGASAEGRRLMKEAFVASSRLEWLFWDSAYRMETWQP